MFIVGLDPGKKQDPAALCTLRTTEGPYHLVDLIRFPLMTSYTDLTDTVVQYVRHPKLKSPTLVIDVGGVGEAVRDAVAKDVETTVGVMTGGTMRGYFDPDTWTWYVAKSDIVEGFQVGLMSGQIKVASSLSLAPDLIKELQSFRRNILPSGYVSYEHRTPEGHGDLAMAAAMCFGYAQLARQQRRSAS